MTGPTGSESPDASGFEPSQSGSAESLHVESVGSRGSPLVLLHGLGMNRLTWRYWIPDLSKTNRLHLVDLKGFGDAPKPRDDRYSPVDQADLLCRWIIRRDLRGVTLVGHSLGGGVALLATLRLLQEDPDRVRRLVLVAPTAYPQQVPIFLRLLGRPFWGPLLLRVLPLRRVIRTALRMAYHPSRPVAQGQVDAYAHPLRSAGARYALSRSAAGLLPPGAEALHERYRLLELPALLIWGRQDTVVPLWVGRRLAGDLPNARMEILEECGHMPQEEVPEEALRHVKGFLGQTE